jgi:hypothetical protein
MIANIIGNAIGGGLSSQGGGVLTFDLLKSSVNYRTTDYGSYLITSGFSDAGVIAANARVIELTTIAPDGVGNANAVAGNAYIYDDVNGDRIAIHEIDGNIASFFPANDMQQASRLFTVSGSQQGISVDPINSYLFIYNNTGTITVKDFAGTTITTYTAPTHSTDVLMYYDYGNPGTWYAARETATAVAVERWTLSGTVVSIAETYWYKGIDGVALSDVSNKIVNFDGSGALARFRFQSLDGKSDIYLSEVAIPFVTEGLVVYPDETIGNCNPAGYVLHGSVVGGNRWMRSDPLGYYLKYDRSPSMTRFSNKFTGGTVSGVYGREKITASVGEKIYGPVYDTDGFTNTENASAWGFEFSEGGDADMTWVGSATAPTVGSTTATDSNLPSYAGWGDTVPSAEQGTPGTFRYKQVVLTVKAAAASALITVEDILTAIPTLKILVLEGEEDSLYITRDDSNRISLGVNQAVPTNGFVNTTSSQRPIFNFTDDYTDDNANNNHLLLELPSEILSDTAGQLIVCGRREATTIRSIHLAASINNTNTHRLIFRHNAAADTPGSEICIEHWDGTAAVVNRVGIADTSLTFKRLDFISTGSAWQILINGVNQVLNVSAGANNGNWFADLPGANRVASGICLGTATVTGRHRRRFLGYSSTVLTIEQNNLLNDFFDQENYLA